MSLIAQRYAVAFFQLCQERQNVEAVSKDLENIDGLIKSMDMLSKFLDHPLIPSNQRIFVLNEIFRNKVHEDVFRLILFLESKKRLSSLADVCEVFDQLDDQARGILRAKVTSVVTLQDHEIQSIRESLETKFKKRIEVDCVVDLKMLGGLKVQVDDMVYDDTLQIQLDQFYKSAIGEEYGHRVKG